MVVVIRVFCASAAAETLVVIVLFSELDTEESELLFASRSLTATWTRTRAACSLDTCVVRVDITESN